MACFNSKDGMRLIGNNLCNSRFPIFSTTCSYGSNEIFVGFNNPSGRSIAGTGNCKVALGFKAGYRNSGAGQVALGDCALCDNSGSYNVAIGNKAMIGSGAGSNNTALGCYSLRNVTSGSRNVGIGNNSGPCITTGNDNVAIGRDAGPCGGGTSASVSIGNYSKANRVSGNRSVAIGFLSYADLYGSFALGACARATTQDAIAIGFNAYSNYGIRWGNSAHDTNCVYGTWSAISDMRDKTDILDLDENLGVNFIRKLRPVKYKTDFRKKYVDKCGFEWGQKDGTLKSKDEHYGFIAQEIKQIAEELNVNFEGVRYIQEEDKYSLTYTELISPIVKTIKQIDDRIQILKNKLQLV